MNILGLNTHLYRERNATDQMFWRSQTCICHFSTVYMKALDLLKTFEILIFTPINQSTFDELTFTLASSKNEFAYLPPASRPRMGDYKTPSVCACVAVGPFVTFHKLL